MTTEPATTDGKQGVDTPRPTNGNGTASHSSPASGASVESAASPAIETLNVAARLSQMAQRTLDAVAIAQPHGWESPGRRAYWRMTFRELDEDSDRIASGLVAMGVKPGSRLAMFVRPGIDFVSLVYAIFKAGGVAVMIDPGMGPQNLLDCLDEVRPDGFIAIPLVHAFRVLPGGRYSGLRLNVTVGRRWFWRGATLRGLRRRGRAPFPPVATRPDDPAAIIFTSGSTGPAKGVRYSHGNFDRQVDEIQNFYGIQPGQIDVACFLLFALFNPAMGVTTVLPDMDLRHPARVDPARLIATIDDWRATQSCGSPAVWDRVGQYCQQRSLKLAGLRRVLSAGAPVRVPILQRMRNCMHPEGEMYTPYGATEALPVASIGAADVLGETGRRTDAGNGVCVGGHFPGIEWKVIRIVDGPIRTLADAAELPAGEIGELIVRGPVVTAGYTNRPGADALAKIADPLGFWHRMGDTGYLNARDRFWFCGRLTQRVVTASGPMHTLQCEAIINRHPEVAQSALVGVGPRGNQQPVIVVQLTTGRLEHGRRGTARGKLLSELQTLALSSPLTAEIRHFLVRRRFPVDIRHNAKICREKLAVWAARRIRSE